MNASGREQAFTFSPKQTFEWPLSGKPEIHNPTHLIAEMASQGDDESMCYLCLSDNFNYQKTEADSDLKKVELDRTSATLWIADFGKIRDEASLLTQGGRRDLRVAWSLRPTVPNSQFLTRKVDPK